jgi:hypothetical protein
MASNGVKQEDVKAEGEQDDAQVKLEADESKDGVKTETDMMRVKTEAQDRVKAENGRVKTETETKPNGIKKEEQQEKQETQQVEPAVADVKPVAKRERQVKKHEESKQEQEEDRSHIRRKAVVCDAGLWDSIQWTVTAGAEVDAGQRLGSAGKLEQGNQRPMSAPCKGRLYILTREQSDELIIDKKEGAAAMRTVAFVEYCIHPVRNGRTCLMCLAVVDDDEENEDMESVNVVSHGQVIRLNVEEASAWITLKLQRIGAWGD